MKYHILNGDALKDRFPKSIDGEIMVARACLVDGPVEGGTLEELFATRATFIANGYDGYSEQDYYDKTVIEFEKIKNIPKGAEVILWFEEDLFCQVNCWFVMALIEIYELTVKTYLVMPPVNTPFQFSSLSEKGLEEIYEDRIFVQPAEQIFFGRLWKAYQENNHKDLFLTISHLQKRFPFTKRAVQAHIDRLPQGDYPGRPKQSLLNIKKELKTEDFMAIYKTFCKREAIYGFGDLQVKRLLTELAATN